ncbi:hypothetical protein LCGC14_1696640 [marine sediment metagenome]|uniref:Uncharacterized protein n=1 Tax=marine sediment metagenome TaxID=412755 RepID=A0A0F9JZQ1_9ZZZZ
MVMSEGVVLILGEDGKRRRSRDVKAVCKDCSERGFHISKGFQWLGGIHHRMRDALSVVDRLFDEKINVTYDLDKSEKMVFDALSKIEDGCWDLNLLNDYIIPHLVEKKEEEDKRAVSILWSLDGAGD